MTTTQLVIFITGLLMINKALVIHLLTINIKH